VSGFKENICDARSYGASMITVIQQRSVEEQMGYGYEKVYHSFNLFIKHSDFKMTDTVIQTVSLLQWE